MTTRQPLATIVFRCPRCGDRFPQPTIVREFTHPCEKAGWRNVVCRREEGE